MKKGILRLLAITVVVVMVMAIVAGCGNKKKIEENQTVTTNNTSASTNNGEGGDFKADISEKVNLIAITMGDSPKDLKLINDEINKLAEKDLNCTVKFVMIPWADYVTQYNLVLSSGQQCDLIFTAPWLQYSTNARKEAFLALDDLLPKYAPELLEFVPKEMWEDVKVGGKIFTMPSPWKLYTPEGPEWREDLRKKYNVPEIKKISDIEAYLEAIKKNEPNMLPTNESSFIDTMGAVTFYLCDMMYLFRDGHHSLNPWYPVYGLDMSYEKPREVFETWTTPEYREVLETMKSWADKGYWSRSVLSNKDDIWQSFQSGKSGAVFMGVNPGRYTETKMKVAQTNPDWEIGFRSFTQDAGIIFANAASHNSMAITSNSKHPERAMMLNEKMVLDKSYNHLAQYGIEGTHYKISDDGHYESIGDQMTNGFPKESLSGWCWYNPELNLYDKTFDEVLDMYKEFDTYVKPNYWSAFAEDYTDYQAERAAVAQVCSQYLAPIQAGLVKDIDVSMDIFLKKVKEAGIDKCREGFIKQWLEYCDERGLE